jgi:hypothetical protein
MIGDLRMKKHKGKIAFAALGLVTILSVLAILAVLASDSRVAFADKQNPDGSWKGNEAPSGPHFNLNIIGMKYDKNANMDCGNGHRIFVPMETPGNGGKPPTKIMLTEAPDEVTFAVIDCDGTDGRAEFMLPNPAPDTESRCTRYSVWIRALGKQGGKAKMTTCAERCVEVDPLDPETCVTWEEVCSVESVTLERTRGKQKFVNVSKELLTICAEICTVYDETTGECIDTEWMRLYLFDPLLQGYFWEYNNNGLKLAQLRFYMEETCYSEDDWSCPPNNGNG